VRLAQAGDRTIQSRGFRDGWREFRAGEDGGTTRADYCVDGGDGVGSGGCGAAVDGVDGGTVGGGTTVTGIVPGTGTMGVRTQSACTRASSAVSHSTT